MPTLKGDQGTVRALNRRLILNGIREHGPLARAQLAELTGLSPAAVRVTRRAEVFSGHDNQGTFASWRAPHAATNPDARAALIAVADQLKGPVSWEIETLASVRERLRALDPQ